MKKNLKKLSAGLAAIMVAGVMPSLALAENEVYVSHFDSFENWTSEKGSATDLPEGFFALDVEHHPTRASQAGSVFLEEDYTRAVALKKGAIIGYRYDAVYKNGVRRVSFDLKAEAEPTGSYFIISAHENDGNDNVYDLWNKGVDGTGLTESGAIDWDYSELAGIYPDDIGFVGRHNWQKVGEPQDVLPGTWHKVEMVFDCDNDMYYAYFDGELVHERSYSANNKTIYLNNNLNETVYLDNFAVYQSEDGAYSANQFIKAEAPYGAISTEGGRLNVDFSRYDAELYFDPEDFIVKDSKGNVVADAVSAAGQGSKTTGAVVILNALPKGEYTISYASAENTSSFLVAHEAKTIDANSRANEKYYYMNEDFEGYIGGVPANWNATVSHVSDAKGIAGQDANGGRSLKMPQGKYQSYMYQFDERFTTGDLQIEFDVKSNGAGWGVGFTRDADWQDADYEKHIAIGNLTGAQNAIYTCAKSSDPGLRTLQTATIKNDAWNHVKITMNMDARTYIYDVDGQKFEAKIPYHKPYRIQYFDVVKSTDTTLTGSDVYKAGLNGIRLMSNGTSDVEFDNVKIYSNDSYNLNNDFDGWIGDYVNPGNGNSDSYGVPQGWHRKNDVGNPSVGLISNVEGKNYNAETNASDYALAVLGGNEPARVTLTRPIDASNSFAVEFDLKLGTTTNDEEFKLGVYPVERLYEGKFYAEGIYQEAVFTAHTVDKTLSFAKGEWGQEETAVNEATGEALNITAGNWTHIKLTFEPSKGVTLYLDGVKSQTFADKVYNHVKGVWGNIAGLSIWNEDVKQTNCIDNLKVYELDDVTKPSIISVEKINCDGTKEIVANRLSEISALTEGFRVNFTAPVAETAETLAKKVFLGKKDGTEISWTGVLSEDCKHYTITFNEALTEDITLNLMYKVKASGSEVAQIVDNVSYGFIVSEGEVKVEKAELMKYVPGRTVTWSTQVRTSPSVWTKATSLSDKDATDYKIFVSGINTTGAEDSDSYWYLTGTYKDEDGQERMNNISKIDLTIPNQVKFEKQLDVPEVAEGETFKAFVWNTDFMPVTDAVTSK